MLSHARIYGSIVEATPPDPGRFTAWIQEYNHHRPHTACANQPPFTQLINVPGQYT